MVDEIVELEISVGNKAIKVRGPRSIIKEDYINSEIIEKLFLQLSNASSENKMSEKALEENVKTNTLNSKFTSNPKEAIEITESPEFEDNDDSNEKYIPLSEVLKRNLAGREVEKLLIIIFYLSDFGTQDFNREEIVAQMEDSGISTLSRKRNLSNNLQTLSKYRWIAGSNHKYYMTDEGVFRAKGILARDVASEKHYN